MIIMLSCLHTGAMQAGQGSAQQCAVIQPLHVRLKENLVDNHAVAVDHEHAWMGNTIRGIARCIIDVQHAIPGHGLALQVRQQWIGDAKTLREFPLYSRRIVGHHNDAKTGCIDVFEGALQLHELPNAEGSPIDTAIEKQQQTVGTVEALQRMNHGVLEGNADSWCHCA